MTDMASPVDFMRPLAFSSFAVCPFFFSLYYVNRKVYPLAQREPVITLIGNITFWIAAQIWMLELRYVIPCFVDVFNVQIMVGITMVCFSMKVWKIFLDAGLTSELERSKFGWFVAHRSWRSRKSLHKVAAVMVVFHACIFVYVATSVSDQLLGNALSCDTSTSSLAFGGLGVIYLLLFITASYLLSKVKDGFFIKSELRMVGIGAGFISIGWMVRIAAELPCEIYECNTVLLWCCWLALFMTSTIYPLSKAMFQRKFVWWWDFCRKSRDPSERRQRRGSQSEASSSHDSSGGSYGESEIIPTTGRNPVRALATQWNPKDPNLARFKKLPLTRILSNANGKEAFRRFTVLEFSVENLLFVDAVNKYRGLRDPTKEDMLELFDKYISNTAPSQVNLPNKIVRQMQESLETADGIRIRAFFDEAYDHVMKLMQRDSYRRFQNTAEFAAVAASMDDVELNERGPSDTMTASLVSEAGSEAKHTPQTPHTTVAVFSTCEATQSFVSEDLPEPLNHRKELKEETKDGTSTRRSTIPRKSSTTSAPVTITETPRRRSSAPTTPTAATTTEAETPRVETPRAETPRAETPRAETPKAETPRTETPRRKSTIKESLSRRQSAIMQAAVQEEEEGVTAITVAPSTSTPSTPTISPTRKVSNIYTHEVAVEVAEFSAPSSIASRGSVKDEYQRLE